MKKVVAKKVDKKTEKIKDMQKVLTMTLKFLSELDEEIYYWDGQHYKGDKPLSECIDRYSLRNAICEVIK